MYQNDSGDACCTECFQLGTKQRFVAKVSLFVWSMDMARLLHLKMFDSDSVPAFESKLRGSPNYLRRNKALYEQFMDLDLKELHLKVRRTWNGRAANQSTEALELFMAMYVTPCLDVEPGACMKKHHLEKLLSFMANDASTGAQDLQIVKSIVTGQVSRHPAVHGVLCAIMDKLRQWERGTHTMRNRHRALLNPCVQSCFGRRGCKLSQKIFRDIQRVCLCVSF